MQQIKMPVEKLNHIIESGRISGTQIDREVLAYAGFFILKNAVPVDVIARYREYYDEYKISPDFDRTKFHLTEVKFAPDHRLASLLEESAFRKIAAGFFGGDVGLYSIRIIKKDAVDDKPVFLHQDIGYHHGSFQRYSLFVPLTPCGPANGGLRFLPGTHKFGHLGDAGSIRDIVPRGLATPTPDVFPGDVIVMDSCLWHTSGPNGSHEERVYYDIHINHADDPATKQVILGNRTSEWEMDYDQNFLFDGSRTQRIVGLYKDLDAARSGK